MIGCCGVKDVKCVDLLLGVEVHLLFYLFLQSFCFFFFCFFPYIELYGFLILYLFLFAAAMFSVFFLSLFVDGEKKIKTSQSTNLTTNKSISLYLPLFSLSPHLFSFIYIFSLQRLICIFSPPFLSVFLSLFFY